MKDDCCVALNLDDPYGARLYNELGKKSVTYSVADRNADFFADVKKASVEGMDLEIFIKGISSPISARLPLIGKYNVMNALQAVSVSWTLGIGGDAVLNGLSKMGQVPGRLEKYIIEGSGTCVIDFAHNPAGVETVLRELKKIYGE